MIKEEKFSILKDKPYLIFLGISFLMGMVFMQLFFTMPTFHNKQFGLSEDYTGLLLLLNGVIIVLLEMPIVHWLEIKKTSYPKLFLYSSMLMAISFLFLLFDAHRPNIDTTYVFNHNRRNDRFSLHQYFCY